MKMVRCPQSLKRCSWLAVALCAAGAALFLLVAYVWLYHDCDLWHLWLPKSANNDEVIYNRQVVGVLTGGQPRGVFGYNESRAALGRFGAWGPVLPLLYGIPGLLVGVGVNTMFWCNVLFAVAGWVIFARGARLSWKKQLVFGLALLCALMPMQQILAGTAESLQYFLIFCVLGASAALLRQFRLGWYLVLAAACGLLTVVRAYTVLLWLFPVGLLWKNHRRHAVAAMVMAPLSLGAYCVITKLCNAPYFSGGDVDLTVFHLLAKGRLFSAIRYEWNVVSEELSTLWNDHLLPTFSGHPTRQGVAFLLLMLLVVATVCSLADDMRHHRQIRLRVCALLCVVCSQLAMLALYAIDPMVRHYTMLMILLLGALVCEYWAAFLICVPALAVQVCLPAVLWRETLPTYDAAMDQQIQTIHTALQQEMDACHSEDPWDYTVAYAWPSDAFHGYLYAVPAGMGIQFDYSSYIANEDNPIHSRYAMVKRGGKAEQRLIEDDWQELVVSEEIVVYECPEGE